MKTQDNLGIHYLIKDLFRVGIQNFEYPDQTWDSSFVPFLNPCFCFSDRMSIFFSIYSQVSVNVLKNMYGWMGVVTWRLKKNHLLEMKKIRISYSKMYGNKIG